MSAFYQKIVQNSEYLNKIRILQIDNELRLLRGSHGERYAEYIGVDVGERVLELEAEKVLLGGAV